MRLIEGNPDISQRQLARELGISLGGVNYCLNALIEKGLVKMERFRASDAKLNYAYVLTPRGIHEKALLTQNFLARKMAEYEMLRAEIESVRQELLENPPEVGTKR
jgi:MarR family transcriptional regulator, temperature-dependent positive regulator of motility